MSFVNDFIGVGTVLWTCT